MSTSFRILKSHGLVYVRYDGFVSFDESMALFAAYAQHPDCRPGQKHLVDLANVTDYEKDFAALMQLQAKKADVFMAEGAQTIIVYYAPTEIGQRLCRLVARSWEPFDSVVALVIEDEAEALRILGQTERSLSELLSTAA